MVQMNVRHSEPGAGGPSLHLVPARPARLLPWAALICFVLGSPCSQAASLVSTNLPPLNSALPDASFSVLRVFGALALVLALFLSGVWCFKNWQRFAWQRNGRPAQLQLLEVKSLGARQALYVVGYQNQRMLLASSPAGVTLVSHLPSADSAEIDSIPPDKPNFAEALQRMLQRKS